MSKTDMYSMPPFIMLNHLLLAQVCRQTVAAVAVICVLSAGAAEAARGGRTLLAKGSGGASTVFNPMVSPFGDKCEQPTNNKPVMVRHAAQICDDQQ